MNNYNGGYGGQQQQPPPQQQGYGQQPDPDRLMEEDLAAYGPGGGAGGYNPNNNSLDYNPQQQQPGGVGPDGTTTMYDEGDYDMHEIKNREFEKQQGDYNNDPSFIKTQDFSIDDEEESDDEDADMDAYPMRELNLGPICFNPLTTFIGVVTLWGVSLWCIVEPESSLEELLKWRAATTEYFTWFYVGTRPLFCFFLLWLYFKYGHIKLGPPDSVPDYSNVTYFAMLLSAGVAVGLFYYGVSEPLWHQSSHWFANAGYHSQDEIDVFALNLTLVHWGLAAWSGYVVSAIAIALAAFRFNLPMTFRSCFYPILGEYTWGWIGDVIDGFAIVVTVSGVCTSLGLGAFQIVAGLQRIGLVDQDISESREEGIQVLIVWGITLIATASVVSGLNNGIKYLSILAFCIGLLLIFLLLILEKTSYVLNLQVQSVGYYLQTALFQINFWTDAFGQLKEGEGRAIDGHAAEDWWMDSWTVFYMAWWTSWSGFVGLFVGCTSKGRTIGEVLIYSMCAPLLFSFIWFGIWGGIGLRQARQALELQELGDTYFDNPNYFLQDGATHCFDVPQNDVMVNGTEVVFSNSMLGVTPVCLFDSKNADAAFYNVLYSFSYPNDFTHGFGGFLTGLSIAAVVIYFVTSSDSGSLVVDFLASNGNLDHHWVQRIFWSATEGAVATALLRAGGSDALKAVQAASIIAGLPFTLFLVYMLQSIVVMCQTADEAPNDMVLATKDNKNEFQMPVYGGVFNVFEYLFSMGRVHEQRIACGMDLPTAYQVTEFFYGLFVPFIPLAQVMWVLRPKPKQRLWNHITVWAYGIFHITWVVLFILTNTASGLRAFGWSALFINAVILTNVKTTFRKQHNYRGNDVGDFISSLFFFPQVLCQLRIECESLDIHYDDDDQDMGESFNSGIKPGGMHQGDAMPMYEEPL
eukprot:CAMPEP_0194035190 /NCGR_PEP_ID=MMETSP0009_2-20130614/7648_1 /TAXON_ID=210454 /ORGANISM="Grammatophora oceanica, Strain CCMP 410" /LENGTH=917 /DNA_ID=CAMNT_0038676457 /DNA_START=171 /DNA_END=2924 /DNA_ORIENTATION=-